MWWGKIHRNFNFLQQRFPLDCWLPATSLHPSSSFWNLILIWLRPGLCPLRKKKNQDMKLQLNSHSNSLWLLVLLDLLNVSLSTFFPGFINTMPGYWWNKEFVSASTLKVIKQTKPNLRSSLKFLLTSKKKKKKRVLVGGGLGSHENLKLFISNSKITKFWIKN